MIYNTGYMKQFVARFVESGKKASSDLVLSRINEAERRLITKGHWKNTLQKFRVVTANNTIALPYNVEKVINVDIDTMPANVFSMGYEFLPGGPGEVSPAGTGSGYKDLEDLGFSPIFFDPPYTGKKIYAISVSATASTIAITGRKANGEVVTESIAVGRWTGGVEGTIGVFPELTSNEYVEVINVSKEAGTDYVALYCYDEDTYQMWFLAKYEPRVTLPTYRRYKLLNASLPTTSANTEEVCNSIFCYCKMRHVELVDDADIPVIQNPDAIKNMVIAIREENSGNFNAAINYEANATKILSEELGNSMTRNSNKFRVSVSDGWGASPNIM